MAILNHLTRKLFAATLTVVALSPFALDGMIQDDPLEDFDTLVNKIAQIIKGPSVSLECNINEICNKYGVDVTTKVVINGFQKAEKSLFDKNKNNSTLLHGAVVNSYYLALDVLFQAALELEADKDKIWDWICVLGPFGRRSLELSVENYFHKNTFKNYLRFVKKEFGDKKVWELLCMKNGLNYSVWRAGTKKEIKPILAELGIEIPEEYRFKGKIKI